MRNGLLPGGTRGTCYGRHVHLAMSHRPTAGLREGSDVILVIDLMRAHNAGCVFYVSDNNVILTEDCVPPPCIARAKCTSTGEAYDLSQFRAAYRMVCVASNLSAVALLSLGHSTTWSVIQARLAISPCSLGSPMGLSGRIGWVGGWAHLDLVMHPYAWRKPEENSKTSCRILFDWQTTCLSVFIA